MKGKSLFGKLSLLTLLVLTFQSCKKDNGIDNDNVIETPYVIFTSDANGTILSTNDGNNYKTVFPGDGTVPRALVPVGPNLLMVKNKEAFISQNGGKNFDPLYPLAIIVPTSIKWPYFILNVPDQDRVYTTSSLVLGSTLISYDKSNGAAWLTDTNRLTDTPYTVESYTELTNKALYAFSVGNTKYSISHLFSRASKNDPWKPVPSSGLPANYNYYIAHNGNTLIVTDYDGKMGAYYSNDFGTTFTAYSGLPVNKTLYATYAPFDEAVLVGTADMGVYKTNATGTFVASNSGIDVGTSVYGITAKSNLYKNGVIKKFVYIATSTGIYRSEDLAQTWVKVKSGDYRLIY